MSKQIQCATIVCDQVGLTRAIKFSDGSVSTFSAKWTEITRVLAFKRDRLTSDLLCIEVEADGLAFEFDEEMEGWESMINALPDYLPGFPRHDEWWERVVHPPFATNMTQLFPAINEH